MKRLLTGILISSTLLLLAFTNFQLNNSFENSSKNKSQNDYKGACLGCHMSIVNKKIKHQPATYDCLKCHQANSNKHPGNNTKGFSLIDESQGLCFTCHLSLKKNIENAFFVHKAIVGDNQCTNCHSPHASQKQFLLIRGEKEQCLSCHSDIYNEASINKDNHKEELSSGPFKHKTDNIKCTECHEAHFSKNQYLLNKKYDNDSKYSKHLNSNIINEKKTDNIKQSKKENKNSSSNIVDDNQIVAKTNLKNGIKGSHQKNKTRREDSIVTTSNTPQKLTAENKLSTPNLTNKHIKPKKDTCFLGNHSFKIIDHNSERNLIATIDKGQLVIVNKGLKFFKYRVVQYVFSSVDNHRLSIARNFDCNVSFKALNILKDAHLGAQYLFEEIIVVDPAGNKLKNQVRSVLIERIK